MTWELGLVFSSTPHHQARHGDKVFLNKILRAQGVPVTYLRLGGLCYGFHWEPLASVILDATEDNESNSRPLFFNDSEYILLPQIVFSRTWEEFENRVFRIITVKLGLRGERIL
jgi:hypothetical protein